MLLRLSASLAPLVMNAPQVLLLLACLVLTLILLDQYLASYVPLIHINQLVVLPHALPANLVIGLPTRASNPANPA